MPEKTLNDLPRDLRVLCTKGNDALQRENFDYAIELFTTILTKEPYVFDCRKLLRTAQVRKSGAAGGFFKRAFSSASSSPLVAKGQLALRKSQLEALQIGEQILNSDANSSAGHKLVADAALAAEMPRVAVMSLEILVKNAPKDKELSYKLAEALSNSGRKDEAEAVLTTLQKEYPTDNEVSQKLKDLSARKTMDDKGYGALATGKGSYRDILKDKSESVALEQEKRQVKAEDVADRLITEKEARLKTEPNNIKVLRDLGELYLQKNDFDRALGYFDKIAANDGGSDASLQKQIAETRVRKFSHALAQLDPNSVDYAEKSAAMKSEKQTYQMEECRQRAERYPTDLQIRYELGQLYFDAGKIGEAIPEFQKAQANPHRKLQSGIYLAKCWEKRGMNDMAVRRLQEILKEKLTFDEEKKDLLYTLGSLLEKMNKKDEAIEQYKLIYEVDAGYKDVAKKVEDFYSGQG
jgi:tetratricopeptide (TPR) repeat protein